MNKYQCIVACLALLVVCFLLSISIGACLQYHKTRLSLGYPENQYNATYPQKKGGE